jgi:hypothetical protein
LNAAARRRESVPESVPSPAQTTPDHRFGQPGHDFTLQVVVELQKTLGETNAHLKNLQGAVDGLKAKVDDLVGWKNKILGGVAALGAVIAVLGFLAGKASDYVTITAPAPAPAPAQAPSNGAVKK